MGAFPDIIGRRRKLQEGLRELDTPDHKLQQEQQRLELIEAYRTERRSVEAWVQRFARTAEDARVEMPMVAPHLWRTVAASRVEWAERISDIDEEIARLEAKAPK